MTETPPEPVRSGPILFLLFVLAAVGLWFGHHLGLEVLNLIVAGAALVGAITGTMGTIAKLIGYELDQRIRPWLQRRLAPVANSPLPWIVCPALLVLMVLYSSVTIVADEGLPATAVTLTPLDGSGSTREDSLAKGEEITRFALVRTNLFGRLYRVEAPGYLAATFTVYPLVSRRVELGYDLAPVPSVLFRPFVGGFGALASSGVFRVSRVGANGEELLTSATGRSAFRLGRPQPATAAMVEYWGLQLDVAEAPPSARARILMWWNSPRQLTPADSVAPLAPGDSLLAEVVQNGIVVARGGVRLGRERLQDVQVLDLAP